MGLWDGLIQGEFVTFRNVFSNKNLSDNAKFLCYSLLMGMRITEVFELEYQLKNKNKKTTDEQSESVVWEFKMENLINWYKEILNRDEIIKGFKELEDNNIIAFNIDEVLCEEEKMYG